jgi:hypothetical protein
MVISEAIGVLIDQGLTATEGLDELDDRAATQGVARIDIAHQVLNKRQNPPGSRPGAAT